MAESLTPKMQAALDKIKANGGRVRFELHSYRKLGVNGHSVNALRSRGLARVEYSDDRGQAWVVLVDQDNE